MRGRLPVMLMALVALALVLSLVAALAPGVSAQDSGAAPEGAAKWMRYAMPSAQELEAASSVYKPNGFQPKNCCITVQSGCTAITTTMPASGSNDIVGTSFGPAPYQERPRWFCTESNNGFYLPNGFDPPNGNYSNGF